MALVARTPLVTPTPVRRGLGSIDFVPNLLVTTLALVAATTPFVQKQQPSAPEAKKFVAAFMSVASLQNQTAIVNPVDQTSETQPKYVPQVDIYPNTILRGIPQPIPFKTDHFTNPKQKWEVVAEQYTNKLLLGIPQPRPFNQFYVESAKPKYDIQLYQPLNNIPLLLSVLVQANPFTPVDTTQRPPRKYDLVPPTFPDNLIQVIPQPIPFNKYDWPNAPSIRYNYRTEDLPSLNQTTLFTIPAPPFKPVDTTAVPPPKAPVQVDAYPNLSQHLVSIPKPVATPSDWPVTPYYNYNYQIVTYSNLLETTLNPQPIASQGGLIRPGGRVIFNPKKVGEVIPIYFDFISVLGQGETISTKVVTCSVFSGTDANPSAMLSGSASSSGTRVSQEVTGGVVGVIYSFLCRITTNLGNDPEISGYLAVEPDVP